MKNFLKIIVPFGVCIFIVMGIWSISYQRGYDYGVKINRDAMYSAAKDAVRDCGPFQRVRIYNGDSTTAVVKVYIDCNGKFRP